MSHICILIVIVLSRLSHAHAHERTKRLIAMKSKKSFKLDKDVHTQLVLDDIDSQILGTCKFKLQDYVFFQYL